MNQHDANPLRLILASASPRRAELLRQAGIDFQVIRPTIEEPDHMGPDVPAEAMAEALSYFKARSVAKTLDDGLVIAADTVVRLDGEIFGKPTDRPDAKRILTALSDTTHDVITGLTLLDAKSANRRISHDLTRVRMRPMSTEAIDHYLDSGAWLGKAGAYGIQDHGDAFIERIDGSFTNVVGLPMELLSRLLTEMKYTPTPTTRSEPV